MSVKAKVEAIIYATEEPVTLNQLASLLKDEALAELRAQEEARPALNGTGSDGVTATDDEDIAGDATEVVGEASPDAESRTDYVDPQLLTADDLTKEQQYERDKQDVKHVKEYIGGILEELTAQYCKADRGMEIRQIAGGYRMGTKPEHHDIVVNFAKSLKPPVRLSLQALETLAVIAYKQPVTVPEISEIRGVDSSGVIATLLDRKLIGPSGRKAMIGRPILYKTTKEFLLRFGLNDVSELPSMEEFEKLVAESFDSELPLETKSADSGAGPDAGPTELISQPSDPVPLSTAVEEPAGEPIAGEDDSAA